MPKQPVGGGIITDEMVASVLWEYQPITSPESAHLGQEVALKKKRKTIIFLSKSAVH